MYINKKMERTFIAVKPDGVQRSITHKIIAKFEEKGYKLTGIKLVNASLELLTEHYIEHKDKPFFPKIVSFMTSGPILAMCWEGNDVVKQGRKILGATNPLNADLGTIRGDYGIDMGRNVCHGSDSVESAERELKIWFSPEEIVSYKKDEEAWLYE